MDTSDITVEILRGIRSELAGMRGGIESLERHAIATNEALAKLHDDATLTNETLGIMSERLAFAEAAAGARVRLDERVDRVETDVQGLARRMDRLEAQAETDD